MRSFLISCPSPLASPLSIRKSGAKRFSNKPFILIEDKRCRIRSYIRALLLAKYCLRETFTIHVAVHA